MTIVNAEEAAVLLIDVQERLLPAMHNPDHLLERCAVLLRVAKELALPLVVTEQYPRGLGRTVAPLIQEASDARVFPKVTFDALADRAISRQLRETERPTLVLAGIEAHICVLQTALSAIRSGYDVHVVAGAVSSRRSEDAAVALARLRQAGVSITTVESFAFECLGSAENPHFKSISKIIR